MVTKPELEEQLENYKKLAGEQQQQIDALNKELSLQREKNFEEGSEEARLQERKDKIREREGQIKEWKGKNKDDKRYIKKQEERSWKQIAVTLGALATAVYYSCLLWDWINKLL